MNKKILLLICLCIVSVCVSCENDSNADGNTDNILQNYEEDTEYVTNIEETEDVQQLSDNRIEDAINAHEESSISENDNREIEAVFNSITEDMLYTCEEYPSHESYWNDSLVLLNQFNENIKLYGFSAKDRTAMLLYVEGEKILLEYSFRNFYEEMPKLNVCDIDNDGMNEVIISYRTITGNIRRYAMMVCDYEDTWNVYPYDDYLQDIGKTIQWQYNKERNAIFFMDLEGNVLTEQILPEWTTTFTGEINYEDRMSFDAEMMLFYVEPLMGLEHSQPYHPIEIVFNIVYRDGEFELGDYYIQDVE